MTSDQSGKDASTFLENPAPMNGKRRRRLTESAKPSGSVRATEQPPSYRLKKGPEWWTRSTDRPPVSRGAGYALCSGACDRVRRTPSCREGSVYRYPPAHATGPGGHRGDRDVIRSLPLE